MHPQFTPSDVARFWSKIDKSGECWTWTKAVCKSGYGHFYWAQDGRKNTTVAHRVSWVLSGQVVPQGLFLLHSCDTPRCVRTTHLRVGTLKDNMRDAMDRGRVATGDRNASRLYPERHPRGERHGCARLNEDQVIAIRRIYAAGGTTYRALGAKFGVSGAQIMHVVRRRHWRHIA